MTTGVQLVRDGTIFGAYGTEIDFRTPDHSVWLTVKAEKDADAEALAAALEAAFPEVGPDTTKATPDAH
jgi:hypothetical protein